VQQEAFNNRVVVVAVAGAGASVSFPHLVRTLISGAFQHPPFILDKANCALHVVLGSMHRYSPDVCLTYRRVVPGRSSRDAHAFAAVYYWSFSAHRRLSLDVKGPLTGNKVVPGNQVLHASIRAHGGLRPVARSGLAPVLTSAPGRCSLLEMGAARCPSFPLNLLQ